MPVIITPPCGLCGKTGSVEVTEEEFEAYQKAPGPLQQVLPRLSKEERELLISGTHPDCFNTLFPPEET